METYDVASLEVVDRQWWGRDGKGPISFSVSLIIRAKNEAELLPACLEAVKSQIGGARDGGAVEIVLVDSGSTDGTVTIAAQHGAIIRTIRPDRFTYGRALNEGVAAASGELAVILSAHAIPAHRLWLANLVEPFRLPGVAAAFGSDINFADATVADRLAAAVRQTSSDRPWYQAHPTVGFSNANNAVRRDIALEMPFDEHLAASEDREWAERVVVEGWRVLYTPWAPVWHSHHSTFAQQWGVVTRAIEARAQQMASQG